MDKTSDALEFQAVHDRFRSRVLHYLTRFVGEGEAEDLTQSVMLKVNEGLPNFRGNSSLSTWIYRIATNAALDRLRGKTSLPVTEMEVESDDRDAPEWLQTPSTETAAIRDEMNACRRTTRR